MTTTTGRKATKAAMTRNAVSSDGALITPRRPAAPRDRVSLARYAASIERARALEAKIKKLQDELSPLLAEVKSAMGDAQTGTIGRTVVATWATTTRETLNTKDLKAEQPEIARKYTRTTTVRTFRWADPQ